MKKVLIAIMLLVFSITLFGCDKNDTKALSSFTQQVEATENIIRNSTSSEIYEVSPSNVYENLQNPINLHKINSYNNISREENLKEQILKLTAYLKNSNYQNLNLNKNASNILKQVKSNLNKYSIQLEGTKKDVHSSVNSIKRSLVYPNINTENAERGYVALNNSMNERYTYLCNIYDNLQFANALIFGDNGNAYEENDQAKENENATEDQENNSDDNSSNSDNTGFQKNIDSYLSKPSEEEETTQKEKTPLPPYNPNYNNYNNGYNNYYGNNYYNGYGNGMYGGYRGYRFGFNRFNPSRNTDTFYPYNRNIDTYRFNPNYYNNLNNPYYGENIY